MSLPELSPSMNFADASAAVVDFLGEKMPMAMWSISRWDGERQVHLEVRDGEYGRVAGTTAAWDDSLCTHAVLGTAPQLAPDAMAVPEYAATPSAAEMPIGSYVGVPITHAGGEVFGTICGIDPERKDQGWKEHEPMLQTLSTLLSTILDADRALTTQKRALELAELQVYTDPLTRLLDRRGWNRYIELEDDRYRRFGDPASIVVVDLDGLKQVNDTLGYAAGDAHIERAGTTLRSLVRASDIVARLGEDEFGVIAEATPRQAVELVRRLDHGLQRAGVAASIGHAPYTIAGGFGGAWGDADRAMHDVKRQRHRAAS